MAQEAKLGIVGFGRLGRAMWKIGQDGYGPEVAAFTGRQPQKNYVDFLCRDAKFPGQRYGVETVEDGFMVGDHHIRFLQTGQPGTEWWNWQQVGVNVVMEATGQGKKKVANDFAQVHLDMGAKAVIVTCPPIDGGIPMFVMGVNHTSYDGQPIISNASCTTNAAAVLLKPFTDKFGRSIDSISASTFHAPTPSSGNVLTEAGKDSKANAIFGNIIPTPTGAAEAVAKVLPILGESIPFTINAFRVVAPTSVLTVSINMKSHGAVSKTDIMSALDEAADTNLAGILGIAPDGACATDFSGCRLSIAVAQDQIKVEGKLVTVVGWYDNEYGYSARSGDLAKFIINSGN